VFHLLSVPGFSISTRSVPRNALLQRPAPVALAVADDDHRLSWG
jgi:hypothetical protein